MLAFTNTKMTKQQLLDQLKLHAAADEIIQGRYWDNGKGCAVGCSVHGSDHSLYEPMFGIPEALAHLEDRIFEGLPNDQAKLWPMQFTNAIRPGADLSKVQWQFMVWLLTDPEYGAKRFSGNPTWGVAAAIDQVADLCARMAIGEPVAEDDWSAAESAAWSAAWSANSAARSAAWSAASSAARSAAESAAMSAASSAAESAARSAASSAAESAARSAASSAAESAAESAARSAASSAAESAAWSAAESAAWSAAESAAWSAARSAAYVAMRDKLLELLSAA